MHGSEPLTRLGFARSEQGDREYGKYAPHPCPSPRWRREREIRSRTHFRLSAAQLSPARVEPLDFLRRGIELSRQ